MLVVYMLFIYKIYWVSMSKVLCLLKLVHCAKMSLEHINLGQVDITQWQIIFSTLILQGYYEQLISKQKMVQIIPVYTVYLT